MSWFVFVAIVVVAFLPGTIHFVGRNITWQNTNLEADHFVVTISRRPAFLRSLREKWYMMRHGAAMSAFDDGESFGEAPDGTRAATMPRKERRHSDEVEIVFFVPGRLRGQELEQMANEMGEAVAEVAKKYGYKTAHGRRRR